MPHNHFVKFTSKTILFFFAFFLFSRSLLAATAMTAQEFSGKDINGKSHSLKDYQGKFLVLYFWATWCPSCRAEVENVKEIYLREHSDQVKFLSVSLDTDRARLKDFIQKNGIPYPVIFDGRGWENSIARDYSVIHTPTFFVIAPNQAVIAKGNWTRDLAAVFKEKSLFSSPEKAA